MKFQLNKFASVLAVAGLVMGLTACGSGDDTVPKAADIPATTVGTTTVAASKAIATALVGTPAITLPALTGTGGSIPAGTTLTFTTTTDTTATALSGFTLKTTQGDNKGVLLAGSCVFKFTEVATGSPFTVGQTITFSPCSFDLNTAGVSATGVQQSVPVAVNFGGAVVTTTVPVTLTSTGSGVSVQVGSTVLGTVSVVTGATGTN